MASILIDIDGFFQPSNDGNKYFSDETGGIALDYDFETPEGLCQQYYLGYRSSMYVCEDSIDDEKEDEIYKTIKEHNQNCLEMAMGATLAHLSGKSHVPVDFLWIVKQFIIEQIHERYHDANKIEIRLSMKPSISAHTKNNIIIFPALARSVLLHCNLLFLNDFFRKDDDKHIPDKIDRQGLARFCLPYFLFCHDNLSVRNLPIIGAATCDAFTAAHQLTNIQLIFIIAHEYAHLLSHHNRKKIVDSEINKDIEKEADDFALDILLRYIKTSHSDTAADVFTALRLLFKYQLLEYETGCLVRGENLDVCDAEFEHRRSNIQHKLIENENLERFYVYDAFCFTEAIELQNILQEYGVTLIDDIIDAFYESENTGEIRPWWKTIKNKQ